MSKNDALELIIPVYLDEQVVMDMIATIDDGFSEISTIETFVIKVMQRIWGQM